MENYLLMAAAVLLMGLDTVARKRYQQIAGPSMSSGLWFTVFLGLMTAVFFFALNGFRWECTPYSLTMAFFQGLLAATYTVVGFRIMKDSIALYALFIMTGGMIIPYVWGLLFLGEVFSWLRLAGLILILASVILAQGGAAKVHSRVLPLCVLVFFTNGIICVITKLHQVEAVHDTVSTMSFVMLVNIFKMLLSALVDAVTRRKASPRPARPPFVRILPLVAVCTLLGGVSYYLQLVSAGKVSASVMFPMMTGGTIIVSALLAGIFYGEKPSRREWTGILMCLAGTLMFL